jgi:hypothetical protein
MEIVFKEPTTDCKIIVGVLTFTKDGVEESRDFCVECETAKTEEDISRNLDRYNRQLEDEWISLEENGYRVVSYKEITPCPLLFLG